MELGMIGLGKMGANMTRRLLGDGHRIVAFDIDSGAVQDAVDAGAVGTSTLDALAGELEPPRAVWVMVPSGDATETTLDNLSQVLDDGDTIIDGGNSNFKETLRRGGTLQSHGLHFVDVGVSGGVWGLEEGYGLMIGGESEPVERLRPIFESLAPAPDRGWGHMGPVGAGHFVKMVHNGIEYGVMQAYAEGFALLKAKGEFNLDVHQVAEAWRFGTVIRSWLLDLTARALEEDPDLAEIAAWVDDSGEGRWTVKEAVDLAVPAPVISQALFSRFRSRRSENYADKLLAAMRHQFGGHAVKED